jgi:DNA-binding phage protein
MGALLSEALAASGLTADQLARLTGIHPSNISRALHSPNTRPATVRKILLALGLRVVLVSVAPKAKSGAKK